MNYKELVSDEAIERVALDEAQQDWSNLKFKPVYAEGYEDGCKYVRSILLPIIEEKEKKLASCKSLFAETVANHYSSTSAKQKDAIGFAEWINYESVRYDGEKWYFLTSYGDEKFTTQELYELYDKQKEDEIYSDHKTESDFL